MVDINPSFSGSAAVIYIQQYPLSLFINAEWSKLEVSIYECMGIVVNIICRKCEGLMHRLEEVREHTYTGWWATRGCIDIGITSPIATWWFVSITNRALERKMDEQKVRLMMILFASNFERMSQLVLGKCAEGVPQQSVLTLSPGNEISDGTESSVLDQNHTLIKESVCSIAYHPPPLALKGGP
jgi:hypothetical protein